MNTFLSKLVKFRRGSEAHSREESGLAKQTVFVLFVCVCYLCVCFRYSAFVFLKFFFYNLSELKEEGFLRDDIVYKNLFTRNLLLGDLHIASSAPFHTIRANEVIKT